MKLLLILLLSLFSPIPVQADPSMIEAVKVKQQNGKWAFSVTLLHPDSGWDHYADGWEVLAPDGTILGFRELLHPHEHEQPFTRSLNGVEIPATIDEVTIRARCNVDGWTSEKVAVALPR